MKFEIRKNREFVDVTVIIDNTSIGLGLLSKEETQNLAVELIDTATELLITVKD